jgi:hypothetical protein
MKYYAEYLSPANWDLLSEDERDEFLLNCHSSHKQRLINMREFKSLKEAKAYLRSHLRGDRDDAIMSLKGFKRI